MFTRLAPTAALFCCLLIGCESEPQLRIEDTSSPSGMWRYETSEVVCYGLYTHALQCKWKEQK